MQDTGARVLRLFQELGIHRRICLLLLVPSLFLKARHIDSGHFLLTLVSFGVGDVGRAAILQNLVVGLGKECGLVRLVRGAVQRAEWPMGIDDAVKFLA